MSGGGSGGGSTTTQSADPWHGAQPFLTDLYEKSKRASDATPTTPFQGRFVTPANDKQREVAHQMMWLGDNNYPKIDGLVDQAQRTIRGDYLDSPYLKQAIEATVRPTIDNLTKTALPAIGSAAQGAGAYGGSRQAFLESQTINDANRTVGDIAAKMLQENYGRERLIQTSVAPDMLAKGFGMQQQQLGLKSAGADALQEYAALEDANARMKFEDELNSYWRAVTPYASALGNIGFPGGSSTSTVTPASGNKATSALLGGLSGAGMGAMAANAGLMGASMGGPAGAAIGLLLGAGMGLMR